jgi:hypothetical protein
VEQAAWRDDMGVPGRSGRRPEAVRLRMEKRDLRSGKSGVKGWRMKGRAHSSGQRGCVGVPTPRAGSPCHQIQAAKRVARRNGHARIKRVGIGMGGRWGFWGLGGHGRLPLRVVGGIGGRGAGRGGAPGPPPGVRLCVATATVAGRRGGGRENALLYYMGGVRVFSTGTGGGLLS